MQQKQQLKCISIIIGINKLWPETFGETKQ